MKKLLQLILITTLCVSYITAEQMQSPTWGYSLDLPEGFDLTSSQEGTRYQFDHSLLPITLIIASYPMERYETAREALENAYTSLQLQGEIESVRWKHTDNSVGVFTIGSSGSEYSGWAASVLLPDNKGTTVFLSYAPKEQFAQCEQVIVSALDSIDTLQGSVLDGGLFTTYAFPKEGDENITLNVNGQKIMTTIDKVDVMASDFVVQREYAILSFFANTPMWKEAWQRFYRVIYRDSHKRLQKASYAIYYTLRDSIVSNSNADFDTKLTQTLLSWVQNFEYVRIPLGTDFVPLPAVISGSGSDCDSRALLLAVIMSHMGYDTMLFVSREYSHALFGIAIDGEGARLDSGGVSFLLGETTAPVSLGLVPQDMSDILKWIDIEGL